MPLWVMPVVEMAREAPASMLTRGVGYLLLGTDVPGAFTRPNAIIMQTATPL